MSTRWQTAMGKRPARVANCSGFRGDASYHMLSQATLGDVDFITGDWLAEMNMAEDAEAYRAGKHPGFVENAWAGLQQSIDVIASKGIKVIINGGSLNPEGLARKAHELASEKNLGLKVAFVSGDDVLPKIVPSLKVNPPKHLDSSNSDVVLPIDTYFFLNEESSTPVSANAYLGARAIVRGLQLGADIIVCGRVSDASPVIGAAMYWHSWTDTDYDRLAGSLIAGHLIECSAYVTGGNFSGFLDYPLENFIDPGFPIAEIDADGSCVITKHPNTGGMVNEDTVKCQLLYELQGDYYLNSDVKAYLSDVVIKSVGPDRVHVSGIRGRPPPPTTKTAIFYRAGYDCQLLVNATGYATDQKWQLFERQLRVSLKERKVLDDFRVLEFQVVGVPKDNPRSQLSSTTYCRVFAEAVESKTLTALASALTDIALRHFSGYHAALDTRTAAPRPILGYYPAIYAQDDLEEAVHLLGKDGSIEKTASSGHPPHYEPLERRDNYETSKPRSLSEFGPTERTRLGDIALGRSGDKGANLNFGLCVRSEKQWEWLRNFMTVERLKNLLGDDWKDTFFVERVEFPHIYAVHFVIYGILGLGVSSSSRLDCLGKGFADFIRDIWVDVPESLLGESK